MEKNQRATESAERVSSMHAPCERCIAEFSYFLLHFLFNFPLIFLSSAVVWAPPQPGCLASDRAIARQRWDHLRPHIASRSEGRSSRRSRILRSIRVFLWRKDSKRLAAGWPFHCFPALPWHGPGIGPQTKVSSSVSGVVVRVCFA